MEYLYPTGISLLHTDLYGSCFSGVRYHSWDAHASE